MKSLINNAINSIKINDFTSKFFEKKYILINSILIIFIYQAFLFFISPIIVNYWSYAGDPSIITNASLSMSEFIKDNFLILTILRCILLLLPTSQNNLINILLKILIITLIISDSYLIIL